MLICPENTTSCILQSYKTRYLILQILLLFVEETSAEEGTIFSGKTAFVRRDGNILIQLFDNAFFSEQLFSRQLTIRTFF